MTTTHRGLSGRTAALVFGLVAMVAAVVLVVVVVRAQQSAPTPRDSGRINAGATPGAQHRAHGSKQGKDQGAAKTPPPLPASRPVSISIPAIGVHTVVNQLGLADDGTLAVPQPGPHLDQAAWFENSPTPGQPGPSIIEGHVDSVEGPSVFFKLGAVRTGDRIVVRRADGRSLTFEVNAVRDYLKTSFPTTVVYGGRDLSQPTLRLITCSDFDASIHHHVGNEVVFAHLVRVTQPAHAS
jgi:sortase (surface protein transpeptidase)